MKFFKRRKLSDIKESADLEDLVTKITDSKSLAELASLGPSIVTYSDLKPERTASIALLISSMGIQECRIRLSALEKDIASLKENK